MIVFVVVNLKEIVLSGKDYNWVRPERCPKCGSVRVWGHGFVLSYFDGFVKGVFLKRYRCPDCKCIMKMKPDGYFSRFQAPVEKIVSSIENRLLKGKWGSTALSRSRKRHWLSALKRKTMAILGTDQNLLDAFYKLLKMGFIPFSRSL